MNRLCEALTGSPLLNGSQFREAAAAGLHTLEGQVWRFTCRELLFDGEPLHEMVASDITTEYAKTQALERNRAELNLIIPKLEANAMRYNVLIVEDQEIPRELFEIYLNASDQFRHLLSIENAAAALSVCENQQVDLILMDVVTELGRSGLDAAEQIKPRFPAIKSTQKRLKAPSKREPALDYHTIEPRFSSIFIKRVTMVCSCRLHKER